MEELLQEGPLYERFKCLVAKGATTLKFSLEE